MAGNKRMRAQAAVVLVLGLAVAGLGSHSWSATAPLPPAVSSPPVAAGPTDPRLEGSWVINTAERQMAPYKDLVGATVTFKGDTFKGLSTATSGDADYRFLKFRPPLVEQDEKGQQTLPHIRLDRALQFLIGDRMQ